MNIKKFKRSALLSAAITSVGIALASGSAHADTFSFSNNADWSLGTSSSVVTDPPPDTGNGHLRLADNIVTPFNHIWVALSGRDSVARIDTNIDPTSIGNGDTNLTMAEAGGTAVFGEYLSKPNGRGGNPSRTTVDQNGDVWVGNRNESSGGMGSVAKISANPGGGTTSTGVWNGSTFDRLGWSNAGGVDNNGGTSTASDSAINLYVRTAGTANRTLAVDADNDLWVGGFGDKEHVELDGTTGAVKTGPFTMNPGGYGGLIDSNGVLWSSGWSTNQITRYDTTNNVALSNATTGGRSYGLGVDSEGNIWNSHLDQTISKLDSNGNLLGTFGTGGNGGRGVAVTTDDNVWVANSFTGNVSRLDNAGNFIGTIGAGATPTGLSVDSNGKVWVTNFSSNTVQRIDPNAGAHGAVDLTIQLGSGANPYNYSDMTGTTVVGTTNPSGFWSYIADGSAVGAEWANVSWNSEAEGDEPFGTGITFEARTADILGDLTSAAWMTFNNGDFLGLFGQFMEVRVKLSRTGTGAGALTPVLSDLEFSTVMSTVPEPSTAILFGSGMLMLAGLRRRRQRVVA